jgi:shikimate kinase
VTNRSERDKPAPCHAHRYRVRTVFLTGFMGSGKTSIGSALAHALSWQFVDLDAYLEDLEQTTIGDMFHSRGEPEFRNLERKSLASILTDSHGSSRVIALGGGTFVQPENADLFSDPESLTIFLDAPIDELWARCEEPSRLRPLRQDPEHFRNLYQARREFYTRAGLHIQTSGKSVQAVAEEIAARLRRDFELEERST